MKYIHTKNVYLILILLFLLIQEDVEGWLIELGLHEYWPIFVSNSYTEQRDLADLKYMSADQISTLFNIKKEGHLRKLLNATKVLQYPTKGKHKCFSDCKETF